MIVEGLTAVGQSVHLGEVQYDINYRAVQTFRLEHSNMAFENVRIKIQSNWGNPNYTCIYRIRIHGNQM